MSNDWTKELKTLSHIIITVIYNKRGKKYKEAFSVLFFAVKKCFKKMSYEYNQNKLCICFIT